MSEPPASYTDDTDGVPPGSFVIRRVSGTWIKWDSGDPPLPSTQAFQMYSQEMAEQVGCPGPAMSTNLESHPSVPLDWLVGKYPNDGFLRLSVDQIRGFEIGFGLMPWCYREDHHPSHTVIFRLDGLKKIPGSIQNSLAQAGEWLHLPPRPPVP